MEAFQPDVVSLRQGMAGWKALTYELCFGTRYDESRALLQGQRREALLSG